MYEQANLLFIHSLVTVILEHMDIQHRTPQSWTKWPQRGWSSLSSTQPAQSAAHQGFHNNIIVSECTIGKLGTSYITILNTTGQHCLLAATKHDLVFILKCFSQTVLEVNKISSTQSQLQALLSLDLHHHNS